MRDPLSVTISDLYRAARNGECDYRIGWIAEGFAMARNSGRLSGEVEMHLRQLTLQEADALVMAAVADERITMGDVARYLIQWHYGVEAAG